MSEKLDHMKAQKEKAEQKLRYYQHQEKLLEHRIQELTRKARTHRLCTRGGMLESFLICPGELTDDQVMELLKLSFSQQEVALALAKMLYEVQEARSVPSQGKLHFPCAASQLSFCNSRPGPKRTPLHP